MMLFPLGGEGTMLFSLGQSSERTTHLLLRSVSPRIALQSCGIYSEASEWFLQSARWALRNWIQLCNPAEAA